MDKGLMILPRDNSRGSEHIAMVVPMLRYGIQQVIAQRSTDKTKGMKLVIPILVPLLKTSIILSFLFICFVELCCLCCLGFRVNSISLGRALRNILLVGVGGFFDSGLIFVCKHAISGADLLRTIIDEFCRHLCRPFIARWGVEG